jgi:hypothetical protein
LLVALAAAISLSWVVAGQAMAHGGSARLLVEPPRVNPGGTVVVEGDDLSSDDEITLVIAAEGVRVELGTKVSDGQGHLTQAFIVPVDLAVGGYRLEAIGSGGDVIAADLVVSGVPIDPAGDGGGQGQDDPLLVPLPSGWTSGLATDGAGYPAPTGGGPTGEVPIGVIVGAVAGLAMLAMVALTLASRGRGSTRP